MDFNMKNRNDLLILSDEALAALCELEFFKGSGPGGQKRNKSSSAVRVSLRQAPELAATDCTERSQHRNRSNAINKLKIILALQVRLPVSAPLPRMECALSAPDYPLFVAKIFDLLTECSFDHKACAAKCGVSTTALLKKLARDPKIFQEFNRRRELLGLPKLNA